MCYLHSQQNCHQQVDHHVPGPQDDRPGADMATAAAPSAVEPVAAAPFESHGHHREFRGPRSWPGRRQTLSAQRLNPDSSVTVSKTKRRFFKPAPGPGPSQILRTCALSDERRSRATSVYPFLHLPHTQANGRAESWVEAALDWKSLKTDKTSRPIRTATRLSAKESPPLT